MLAVGNPAAGELFSDVSYFQPSAYGDVGGLRIRPSLETIVRFDDNAALRPDGRSADRIGILRPGVRASLRGPGGSAASATYRMSIERFREHERFNGRGHELHAAARAVAGPLALEVRESRSVSEGQASPVLAMRVGRRDDARGAGVGWDAGRAFSAGLEVRSLERRYALPQGSLTHRSIEAGPSLAYRWAEERRLLADWTWLGLAYPRRPGGDGSGSHGRIGADYTPSPRMEARIMAGWQTRRYDDPHAEGHAGPTGLWRLRYAAGPRTTLSLRWVYDVQDAPEDPAGRYYLQRLSASSLRYRVSTRLTLDAEGSVARRTYASGWRDRAYSSSLEGGSQIFPGTTAAAGVSWTRQISSVPSQSYGSRLISLICRIEI
ncbi:MAG: outer membrane beta-barrel protein [Elusimicrobiota bacterium]